MARRRRLDDASGTNVGTARSLCHSFFIANARAATSNVARNSLQPNRLERVDRFQARRYISLRSRAAAGTGRRKAPPSVDRMRGRESLRAFHRGGGGAGSRESGSLGATF